MSEPILSQEDEERLDAIWEEICQMDDERLDEVLRGIGLDPEKVAHDIGILVDGLLAKVKAGEL